MRKEEKQMNFAVVPNEFLENMNSEIKELKNLLREKKEAEIGDEWLESVKIPKLLGISRKTWQNYRDRRLLPFSQIGNKIYVKRSDIEAFMKAHYIDRIESCETDTKSKL